MKSLSSTRYQREVLERLARVRADSRPRWGTMSSHQMICHVSDSIRGALGEKHVSPSTNLFKCTVVKWVALWVPLRWPHGVKTSPEMDQLLGGTRPAEFAGDVDRLRDLLARFCRWEGEFAPHAMLGPLSRKERMRHAYLHLDHHLRQFGV